MILEGVEVVGPIAAVAVEPGVDLGEAVAAQRVDAALRVGADLDEAGFAEHAEMAGDGGLGERGEGVDQLARGDGAAGQLVENGAPGGVG